MYIIRIHYNLGVLIKRSKEVQHATITNSFISTNSLTLHFRDTFVLLSFISSLSIDESHRSLPVP